MKQRLIDTMTRLGLTREGLADYLGVPVPTCGKWLAGTREPGSTLVRLLDVLQTIEVMAPGIHAGFMPEPRPVVKRGRPVMQRLTGENL